MDSRRVADPLRSGLLDNFAVRAMFARGWAEEVRALRAGGVATDARAMLAVGYRDIAQAQAEGRPVDEALIAGIVAQTRQYARRQRSFFKQEKGAARVTGFGEDAAVEVAGA